MRRTLLVLALAALAPADVVVLKSGKKIEGRLVANGDEVVINTFNSSHPQMTLGVERFPKSKVKRVLEEPLAPHQEFQRRLRDAKSAGDLLALAEWCKTQKRLKDERLLALETILRREPGHEEAARRLGSKAPKGDWPAQYALARRYVVDGDATALAEIERDPHFPWTALQLRRAARSAKQRTGLQEDRPVALRADKLLENARYTLFVPEKYDPLRPTPLVVGLHGGGAGGADGKLVVGSGKMAMPFYQSRADARGWICVCPDALRAGWGNRANDDLIDAVLDELCALYHIDEHRIYLVGHSMGGGGAWAQGARLPEVWAAVAPAASFGVQGIDKFKKTRTGFYVYHSDDDPRTRVEGVRPAMLGLPGSGLDFVYTELPGRGHSFPAEVVDDIFEFFSVRLLAPRRRPTARPKSSFERKLSRDEKKYLPDLDDAAEAGGSFAPLLKDLKTGGGVAQHAVPALVAHPDPKVDGAVAKLLVKASSGSDVRRFAAAVLGGRKAKGHVKALGRALLIEEDGDALLAILDALAQIDVDEAGPDVVRFLKKRSEYLDRRRQGSRIDNSDWAAILPTLARAASLVGTFRPKDGAQAIAKYALEPCFLDGLAVVFDTAVQSPLPPARALASAACGALARLEDPGGRAVLERLRDDANGASGVVREKLGGPIVAVSGWSRDPAIAGHVREALETLGRS